VSVAAARVSKSRQVLDEAGRRRTFAIISHPDAGKTTLTEKLLLYAGAVSEAGQVKARRGRRPATSDWMELERSRGISVSSTVLRFEFQNAVLNLLDTPGHRDFSEDTLRVVSAVDSAVMLLDAAKGVEPQTLRLFEVARERGIPLITFINKYDRPGLEPLELLDNIERELGIQPTPVTWPVGIPGDFRGVVDRRDGAFYRYTKTPGGTTRPLEEAVPAQRAADDEGDAWGRAGEEMALLDAVGARFDTASFRAGETTPVFFGSALSNFGVRLLLHALVKLAPSPAPWPDDDDRERALDAPFSGFVFKVQSNLDPQHRDRLAFVRVTSGRFERGMRATHARTGRPFAMNYAHEMFGQERQTIEEGYPGDVVGLVNALDLAIGDTLYVEDPVTFPRIPTLTPEHFVRARSRDTSRYKQFRRGLVQLEEEGVVQVLRHPHWGDQAPVLAGVGPMQFEVATHRLEREFGARVELEPAEYRVARRTDDAGERALRDWQHGEVLHRTDGTPLAVFTSDFHLRRFEREHPDVLLDRFMSG
jgi:peptide chain release factor 3